MSKYMMMGATYCLLKYIESTQSFSFAPGSLKLKIYDNEAGDFLKIDRRTALNLELINNTRTGSQKNTLFGTINKTRTAGGARFLRAQLLRPSCEVSTITTRLDAVSFLVDNDQMLVSRRRGFGAVGVWGCGV